MIQDLNRTKGDGNMDVNRLIMSKLKEIVRGDEELEKLVKEEIDMSDEDLIKSKDLQHLIINRPPQIYI